MNQTLIKRVVTDPALCPIPPGFKVLGNFNDGFEHFKDATHYNSWKDRQGNTFGLNFGISKRWRNPHLRSNAIVCGFQFKIGPERGSRFSISVLDHVAPVYKAKIIGKVTGGDVNIHFPRRNFEASRGSYVLSISWDITSEDGQPEVVLGSASLNKEIPHGNYGDTNNFTIPFRGHTNPDIKSINIKDGQWHSLVAVIYNDWYRPPSGIKARMLPIIGLWYSSKPSTNFKDFMFVGMGADFFNIPPGDPLMHEIGDDHHPLINIDDILDFPGQLIDGDFVPALGALDDLFLPGVGTLGNLIWGNKFGDDIFESEHPLQIRVDDVPFNQLEVRSMYAANVKYVGVTPSTDTIICRNEAKAIHDALGRLAKLEEEREKLAMEDPGVFDERIKGLDNILIPNAKSDVRAAEFLYFQCAQKFPSTPDVHRCETFEEAVKVAQAKVDKLKQEINGLESDLSEPELPPAAKAGLERKLKKARENLTQAEAALTDAQKALEKCKKGLPSG
ncbi:MAG TPA: hypothetical protein VD710_07535 [Nitrososphaeraceae archaeon]|nr:hypothetical protein [Nitrososphaeraceae archaeon]